MALSFGTKGESDRKALGIVKKKLGPEMRNEGFQFYSTYVISVVSPWASHFASLGLKVLK